MTPATALLWQPALEDYSVQTPVELPKGVEVVLAVILTIGLVVGVYFLLKALVSEAAEACGRVNCTGN